MGNKRVAIVTGAGKIGNIGYGIAEKLASVGFDLVVADVNFEGASAVAKQLGSRYDVKILAAGGNLSEEKAANAVIEQTMEQWGMIDVLVNNAGGGIILPFLEHTRETLVETINRNLWTTLWMCRAALPVMVKQNHGRIINIGAESVRNGLWDHAAYNAAKGGVHALTTGLAREFAPYNIHVNTVAPSGTLTAQRVQDVGEEIHRDRVVNMIPLGRRAKIEEIAGTVAFLASDDSNFITGQVISVNGGSSML